MFTKPGGATVVDLDATFSQIRVVDDVRTFAEDCQAGNDDWAYVDLLVMRQDLNHKGQFAGDVGDARNSQIDRQKM